MAADARSVTMASGGGKRSVAVSLASDATSMEKSNRCVRLAHVASLRVYRRRKIAK